MDGSTVIGHLDGLEGSYIVGWAVSRDVPNCSITVTNAHETLVASGLASVEREDLRSVGDGRCNLAFRIPLPAIEHAEYLHVRAEGVELRNSPLRLGLGAFDGFASILRGAVDGWVTERYPGFQPPLITVVDQDGNIVMECQSAIEGAGQDEQFLPARFFGDLDTACFGRGERQLSVMANGVKFAALSCNLLLHGHMETVSAQRCLGWLLSPDAPGRRFQFEVWRDGKPVAKAKCDLARADVQSAHPGCLLSGFDITLPPTSQTALDFTTLSFRLPGSTAELFEGPYVLGSRPGLVTTARNVSRVAIGRLSVFLNASERAILQTALSDFISHARQNERLVFQKQCSFSSQDKAATRLNIVIPIYRGIAITRACIESVLDSRSSQADRVVLVNDRSPEPGMASMLEAYGAVPNLFILANHENLGFVKSVNRGLSFCDEGDVILLNSDTHLFPGGLNELYNVAHSSPDIGTVTAISNNATIFSYPHVSLRCDQLADISWEELAAIALEHNRGATIDVPTGHGFCMLIKREVLRRVGRLDETFGRGYGEENDLCSRAADLGYRNVATPAVLVEHRESTSFAGEKAVLLATNLPILEARYPEYTPVIMEVERRDDFRSGRWALDAVRLNRASEAGIRFVLVVCHKLGGGTTTAIKDIEATVGYGGATKLTLICRDDGFMELSAEAPLLLAIFSPHETAELLRVLSAAEINLVVVHQVLGFCAEFIEALGSWVQEKHGIFYTHDFYPICPRVTMIDAVQRFCNLAPSDVCKRCVELGGAHEASRMDDLTPEQHRQVFATFLGAFKHVIAPSQNTAAYYASAFPEILVENVPHPAPPMYFPPAPRQSADEEIVLFGAIGPHKGSSELLEIAHLARLTHPSLHFKVIGYTNRDDELLRIGNVSITGAYTTKELPGLVGATKGRLALFLSTWPETFSYTLTEAVHFGFIPLVPNIGAPAERVRAARFGAVFEFPIVPAEVLGLIADIAANRAEPWVDDGRPSLFSPDKNSIERTLQFITKASFA